MNLRFLNNNNNNRKNPTHTQKIICSHCAYESYAQSYESKII